MTNTEEAIQKLLDSKKNWIVTKISLNAKAYVDLSMAFIPNTPRLQTLDLNPNGRGILYNTSTCSIPIQVEINQKEEIIIEGYPNTELGKILYEKTANASE